MKVELEVVVWFGGAAAVWAVPQAMWLDAAVAQHASLEGSASARTLSILSLRAAAIIPLMSTLLLLR